MNCKHSGFLAKTLLPPHVIALILAVAISIIPCLSIAVGVDEALGTLTALVPWAVWMASVPSIGGMAYVVALAVHVLCSHSSTRGGTILCAALIVVASVLGTVMASRLVLPLVLQQISVFASVAPRFGACISFYLGVLTYLLPILLGIALAQEMIDGEFSFSERGLGLVLTHAGSIKKSRYTVLALPDPECQDRGKPSLIVYDKLRFRIISDSPSGNEITVKRLTAAGYHIEEAERLGGPETFDEPLKNEGE